jgi:hypothetical protein
MTRSLTEKRERQKQVQPAYDAGREVERLTGLTRFGKLVKEAALFCCCLCF